MRDKLTILAVWGGVCLAGALAWTAFVLLLMWVAK